jgi:hypothetical protein
MARNATEQFNVVVFVFAFALLAATMTTVSVRHYGWYTAGATWWSATVGSHPFFS